VSRSISRAPPRTKVPTSFRLLLRSKRERKRHRRRFGHVRGRRGGHRLGGGEERGGGVPNDRSAAVADSTLRSVHKLHLCHARQPQHRCAVRPRGLQRSVERRPPPDKDGTQTN
jgi:hypothetical protein